jgi:hypothetical protein
MLKRCPHVCALQSWACTPPSTVSFLFLGLGFGYSKLISGNNNVQVNDVTSVHHALLH